MGVQGLWEEVKSAGETTTWGQLSDSHFRSNKPGARGLRVGVDLSVWIYQAKKTISLQNDDGEGVNAGLNADLRVIFYRACKLLGQGILAVFVSDGKGRPAIKRGKIIPRDSGEWDSKVNKLFNMFRLMGMEIRRAPGEAEAELAAMAERGEIDAVLSDDVDGFLFGVPLLIRTSTTQANTASAVDSKDKAGTSLPSSSKRVPSLEEALSQPYPPIPQDHKDIVHTFSLDKIKTKTKWTQEDMFFFALFSGGDYSKGLEGCGAVLVKGLIRGGYSRKLMQQIRNTVGYEEARKKRLKEWREEVAEVFRTNSSKLFDSKHPKLAQTLLSLENFPDSSIIDSYLFPLVTDPTSPDYIVPSWDNDVNLKQLIPFVSRLFEWGHEQVIAKFRNKMWLGILMRELRRKALEQDAGRKVTPLPLVKSVVAYSSASITAFTPSYYVHLDSATYDSLVTPCLPKVDPFPFPDYDKLDSIEAERTKEERKKLGRAQNPPKPPETGDFRFYVPVGFIAVDENCKKEVQKWIRSTERQKKRKEGKIDDAEDSDERDANDAKEDRERRKLAQMREEMLGKRGPKEKGKGKDKGKGKENAAIPVKKRRKRGETTKPSATSKILSPASSQDSDILIIESKTLAPTTSRLRKQPKKAPPSLGNSFSLSKTSLASAANSKKPSSPIVPSPTTSPPSSSASSSSLITKSSKRSISSNPSSNTSIDSDRPLSASPRPVKRTRVSSSPAPLANSLGRGIGDKNKIDSGTGASSPMSETFEFFCRPRESGTLPCLQQLRDAGYLPKKDVETLVLSDSD